MSTPSLAAFEPHRPRLLRIAYRMLGTMMDAEDVVQDAYIRWHETDRSAVVAAEGLLVRTVVRLAIDKQRRRKTERASYYGEWLPGPWLGGDQLAADDMRNDDLSYAAQVLLERLGPDERAAFLMREMFDLEYDFIADTLDKSEAAARKLVQRAREHLAAGGQDATGGPPRHPVSRADHALLLQQLMAATRAESHAALEALLSSAAQLVSDGGGKVFAARYPLLGAARVANTLWRVKRKLGDRLAQEVTTLAGEPTIVSRVDGQLYMLVFVAAEAGRIREVYLLLNPDKLPSPETLLAAANAASLPI